MDGDKIPFYLKKLGETVENKVADALGGRSDDDKKRAESKSTPLPPMRGEGMEYIEPDWDDIDRKADLIVARYAVVSAVWNVLPPPLDVMGVTATFAKMTTELAGVYQVIVSSKRARQMGWAIATTTASVLGIAFAGSRLVRFIPGGGWLASLLLQAPVIGAVAWAAGDALKGYFKATRMGAEPGMKSLQESFAKTLHLRLKKVKVEETVDAEPAAAASVASTPAATAAPKQSDSIEKIAGLHELMRQGAITQAEYEAKKAELLKQM